MNKYTIIISYDDAERVYVAKVPDLPGCVAHGTSYEGALKKVLQVVFSWINVCKEKGWEVPELREINFGLQATIEALHAENTLLKSRVAYFEERMILNELFRQPKGKGSKHDR